MERAVTTDPSEALKEIPVQARDPAEGNKKAARAAKAVTAKRK